MKRFEHILYVAEPSVDQTGAIARAVSLARSSQARLDLVDVVPRQSSGVRISMDRSIASELASWRVKERRTALESLIAPFRDQVEVHLEVLTGETRFLEVIRAVLRKGYDLVLKAGEDPDWIDRLLGSEDMHLLRKCPCPVWLMKPEPRAEYKCILAAVDYDPDQPEAGEEALNRSILGLAAWVALGDFAELHVVHAWDAPEAGFIRVWATNPDSAEFAFVEAERARQERGMRDLIGRFEDGIGAAAFEQLGPRVHLPRGEPFRAIPALVEQLGADLVVMGTVARTGIPGLIIGNTAEAILDQLRCSLVALKPPGFVSPVLPP